MKTYNVTIGGVDHTMQLDDDEAKRLGLLPDKAAKEKPVPANKAAAKPKNKAGDGAD